MTTEEESILKNLKELAADNASDTLTYYFLYTLTFPEIRLSTHEDKEFMKKMFFTIQLLKDAQKLLKK